MIGGRVGCGCGWGTRRGGTAERGGVSGRSCFVFGRHADQEERRSIGRGRSEEVMANDEEGVWGSEGGV